MTLITQGKTNWKSLAIIFAVAVIFAGGIFVFNSRYFPIEEGANEPYLKIISPNGGERWMTENTYNITWSTEGLVSNDEVSITLYDDTNKQGTSNYLVNIAENVSTTLGDYSWTIPDYIPSGQNYKISVDVVTAKRFGFYVADTSDGYFSITQNKVSDWQTYPDSQNEFGIKYPNTYVFRAQPIDSYQTYSGNKWEDWGENSDYMGGVSPITVQYSKTLGVVYLENPEKSYPNTDLDNAFVTLGLINAESKDECNTSQFYPVSPKYPQFSTGTEIISNVQWDRAGPSEDAATGHASKVIYYSAYVNGLCYVLSENIHTSFQKVGTEGIMAVDENALFAELHDIISTFKFIQ